MTNKNFLIIIEGEKTEKNIMEAVFKKYGFQVECCKKLNLSSGDFKSGKEMPFDISSLKSELGKVFIMQGERNRLSNWLNVINGATFDYDSALRDFAENFAGVFLLYDVDHNSNEVIECMSEKFKSENDLGLLLLSSPCVEVLSDTDPEELKVEHLKEYKVKRNIQLHKEFAMGVEEYIIKNFEKLAVHYLDKNREEFSENNIMEHPRLVVSKINAMNVRDFKDEKTGKIMVWYRYFTTVIYVCIAYILGLTKEIDNYQIVRDFFEKSACK